MNSRKKLGISFFVIICFLNSMLSPAALAENVNSPLGSAHTNFYYPGWTFAENDWSLWASP